jgi:hypothetical protein
MQSLPIDLKGGGEKLVHWTSPEVNKHFQGTGTPVPSTVPCNMKEEEECHLLVDSTSREGGNPKGLHASL